MSRLPIRLRLALAFAVAPAFGAVLLYCFWLVLATGSFWVVRMWFLPELFEGIFQTGRFPIGIYPDWLRFRFTFLVPIAFAITVPAEAVTSRLDWQTLLFAAVFTVVAFAFSRWFWRTGHASRRLRRAGMAPPKWTRWSAARSRTSNAT